MLSDDYLPKIGGIASHIYHLSRALQSLGYEIVIVNPVKSQRDFIKVDKEAGLTVYRVFFSTKNLRFVWVWETNRAAKLGIKRVLDDFGGFDILHQHTHLSTAWAAKASKGQIPWVWTNHTSGFLNDLKYPLRRKLLQLAYRDLRGLIGVSLERYHKAKALLRDVVVAQYIPNGVDTDLFNPQRTANRDTYNIDAEDFVVLCPSRIAAVKGTIFLARAIKLLVSRYPEVAWKFVLVGSDPDVNTEFKYIEEVRSLLCEEAASGHVRYLGNVSFREMAKLYSLANVVVIPSLAEGFSLAALEAMASRKPLIASNVGGLPEVVQHEQTGLLVPMRDFEALAQAILRLYEDLDLRAKIAKGGYDLAVNHYSWQLIAKQTADFYERVIRG